MAWKHRTRRLGTSSPGFEGDSPDPALSSRAAPLQPWAHALQAIERTCLGDLLCLAGLLLIVVLLWWPAWQEPDSFWYRPGAEFSDLTAGHWPKIAYVIQSWRQYRQIPLWLPLTMGGAPLVGNPLSAFFYPPNWLFLLLPINLALHVILALHLFGAGAAFYGLVRWSYGRSRLAAFVAGVGYMLTPKLIAYLGVGHLGLTEAFAWLPLLLWLLRRALQRADAYSPAWCGAALALCYFADPRIAFYGALLLGSYALYRLAGLWRQESWRAALRAALRLSLAPAALLLVGAVQMLPTLELMTATTRAALTLQDAGFDSLPWRYLIGYLIADRGGYHEWMTYLGLAPLGLALLAVWRGAERERWFWIGFALLGVLYSLGTNAPLFPIVYHLFPSLGWIRVPTRALLLVALAVNLLAAWGVDALSRGAWSPTARRWATRIGFAGLVTCLGLGGGFLWLLGPETPAAVLVLGGIGAALMALLLLTVRRWLPLPAAQLALASLVVVDLWSMARSLVELRPASEVFATGAAPAAFLSARQGRFRVYSPSYSIPYHVGSRSGLEQLDGVDGLILRWTAGFMSLAGGYPIPPGYWVTIPVFPHQSDMRTCWQDAVPDARLLGLLNDRFVVAEFPISAPDLVLRARTGSSYVYENRRCMPRAFVVTQAERAASWEDAQARLAGGFDPASGALVEGGPALDGPQGWQPAQVTFFSANRIVVEAQADRPALLVLGETWYPGWQVLVDGVAKPLYRVDGIARGVYLEPGAHVVTWRYRPASLRWGGVITLLGLAGLCVPGILRCR
jgi:hypothetical protein